MKENEGKIGGHTDADGFVPFILMANIVVSEMAENVGFIRVSQE